MTDTGTTEHSLRSWIGHDLIDEGGNKIGRIDDIYVDEQSGEPEWVAVTTGLFGSRVSFVPLRGLSSDGESLVSPWTKDHVKDAPHAEADGHLSEQEEAALYTHYGMSDVDSGREVVTGQARFRGDTADTGRDTSGPNTDSAMTRSEEELEVGKTQREAGRVRLRKWIETDRQTVTVPVRKEKVQVVHEPITDANVGAAMDGPDLSSEEHEMVLNEEEVVVDKKVVPKERVRLDKETEVEQRQVTEDVRKERIDMEGGADDATRRRRT
jgi:uncharacterized protein (TIGR02271 family)